MSRSRNSRKGKRGATRWGCPSKNCDYCASAVKRDKALREARQPVELPSPQDSPR